MTEAKIRDLIKKTLARPEPVLSLYIDVNPATPGNSPRAIQTRARTTMGSLEVPEPVAGRVLDALAIPASRGRVLAIFAGMSDTPELLPLDMDLPVVDPTTGHVEARWGKPYVTPLLAALDRSRVCAVLYVDRDRWRLFVIRLGGIEEIMATPRPTSPGELDNLEPSKTVHPAYEADRGSSATDDAAHHLLEVTRRFYIDSGAQVSDLMHTHQVEQLILMGTDEYRHLFESELPARLRTRIVGRLPALSHPGASPSEVLSRASQLIDELREHQEALLLAAIEDHGIIGLAPCLHALQEGKLDTVAVPWQADYPVYRELATGYVASTPDAARARVAASVDHGAVERVLLADLLPDLSTMYGTHIAFVEGAHKAHLIDKLGGMGGLPRW